MIGTVFDAALALDGFTVGITADRRWEEQAELLRRRGANILHGPSIRTLALGPEEGLRVATFSVIENPPDIVIANTGIGMRSWFGAADSWGIGEALLETLSECRIYARGPKASAAVHQAGLGVTAKAASERLEEVVDLVLSEDVTGVRIAFQRHGDDVPDVLARLRGAGAEVLEVPVYEWIVPEDAKPAIKLAEALISGRAHAVTFTSAPAVRNFLDLAAEADLAEPLLDALNERVLTVCVGPVCAGAAVEEGIREPIVPDKARLGPMIRELADRLGERRVDLVAGSHAVTLAGTAVWVDGIRVDLTEREAALVALLATRPGVVFSKATLAAQLWGGGADEHVVEVTVGRLRRRLGPLGDAIAAVPRRGYRFDAVAP